MGEEPDVMNARPRLNHILMESDYGLGKLTLNFMPTRVDWFYQASSDSDDAEFNTLVPSLGKLVPALETFTNITDIWFALNTIPQAHRIALGMILEIPADDRQDAYSTLTDFLPNMQLNEDSSDFIYQINRHRHIQVDEIKLRINRLSKWSARAITHENLVFHTASLAHASSEIKSVASHLELDVNTQQNSSSIMGTETQKSIFSQLVGLGLEIAEQGDIP